MSEPHVEVTPELMERYLNLTQAARNKATPLHPEDSEEGKRLVIMMQMADSYASDAQWFVEQGDLVRAFGAINYGLNPTDDDGYHYKTTARNNLS